MPIIVAGVLLDAFVPDPRRIEPEKSEPMKDTATVSAIFSNTTTTTITAQQSN